MSGIKHSECDYHGCIYGKVPAGDGDRLASCPNCEALRDRDRAVIEERSGIVAMVREMAQGPRFPIPVEDRAAIEVVCLALTDIADRIAARGDT